MPGELGPSGKSGTAAKNPRHTVRIASTVAIIECLEAELWHQLCGQYAPRPLFAAAREAHTRFHEIHRECRPRIHHCPYDERVVTRQEVALGYDLVSKVAKIAELDV